MSIPFSGCVLGKDVPACPDCGRAYLHHKSVVAYSRDTEDGPGSRTYVTTGRVESCRVGAKAIDGRRDVCDIVFECEDCEGNKVLHILQHKGHTLLSWEV